MMRFLFTISLIELLVGGGGRLTAIGPISLRMVLFATCLGATLVAILFPRRRSEGLNLALCLVLAFLLVQFLGLLNGGLNGEQLKQILAEFQQALYWLAAPFFALMLQTRSDVERCARIVTRSGIALAIIYLLIVASLITGIISFGMVSAVVRDSGEITVRSGEFFVYKGFLYLCVAIVFLIALRPRRALIPLVLLFTAMVLTFTRGFVVSTSVAVLLMLIAQRRWPAAISTMLVATAAAAFIWVYLPSSDTAVADKYQTSSGQRVEDMLYIAYNLDPGSLLFGHGFGSLINNRFLIENTYLWALWKLGLLGVAFWMSPLILCLLYYHRIEGRSRNRLANAYLFGTILVYLQTALNPFLNNPIGLSFVLLSIFSLRVLSREPPGAARLREVLDVPALPGVTAQLLPGATGPAVGAAASLATGLAASAAPLGSQLDERR